MARKNIQGPPVEPPAEVHESSVRGQRERASDGGLPAVASRISLSQAQRRAKLVMNTLGGPIEGGASQSASPRGQPVGTGKSAALSRSINGAQELIALSNLKASLSFELDHPSFSRQVGGGHRSKLDGEA